MEKVLVPISSAPQPTTKSSDVLVHVNNILFDILDTCLELFHAVKGKGSKRSDNGNQDLWTSVNDRGLLKDFPEKDVGDGIQEICATPAQFYLAYVLNQADHLLGFGKLNLKHIPYSSFDQMLPDDVLVD
eukprot:4268281-Ditylum_brightwellii.AAC.1